MKFITTLILFCTFFQLSAQGYFRNSIQLSANADFPIAHEIQRDYPYVPFGNDMFPKKTFAFGGTITYRKHFENRLSLDIGLTGGTDSDYYDVVIQPEFLPNTLDKEYYRKYYDFSYLFGGLNMNIGYDIFQFKKSLVSLKTGLSAISFLRSSVDKKLFISWNSERVQIFENNLLVNEDNNIYLLSVSEIDYRFSITKKFFIGVGVNVKISLDGKDYVKGSYRLIGQNRELTGTVNKWWLSSGANIYGGYYFGK